jgi:hypothetical protein
MPMIASVPQWYHVGGSFMQLLHGWLVSHGDGKFDVAMVIHVTAWFGCSVKGVFRRRPCLGFGYGRQ